MVQATHQSTHRSTHQSTLRDSDYLGRMLGSLMRGIFAVAIFVFLAAPLLALSWRNQPFAGFLIAESLVVNRTGAADWPGVQAGIEYPQKVERIAGQVVQTPLDFNRVLAAHQVGETISVFTRTPDGEQRLYPNIPLIAFPNLDMWRIFWMPYLVGVVYLSIGLWILRIQGHSRAGRTLALFCVCMAGVCGFLFDIYTTHRTDRLWTLCVANIGGALIGLALRFPEEWIPVRSRTWLLAIPYLISLALGVWSVATLFDETNPWAYVQAVNSSYQYAALGMLIFFGVIVYRARKGTTTIIRRQARLVLAGSFIAFIPITVWLLAPLFGRWINFNPFLFLPPLLLFPLSIAIAILRFRLWDIDNLVNRAFVYGVATAIVAGVFSALIGLSQRMFVAFTGEKSDAAVVISTLIIAAIFTPIRTFVQGLVDRQLRAEEDHMQELRSFGAEVEAFVQMSDVAQISNRLLAEAVQSLGAESGALSLMIDDRVIVQTNGPWQNDARLSVALGHAGRRYGILQLGAHRMKRPYSEHEGELLQQVANQVAVAIRLALPHYGPVYEQLGVLDEPALNVDPHAAGANGSARTAHSPRTLNGNSAFSDDDAPYPEDI